MAYETKTIPCMVCGNDIVYFEWQKKPKTCKDASCQQKFLDNIDLINWKAPRGKYIKMQKDFRRRDE